MDKVELYSDLFRPDSNLVPTQFLAPMASLKFRPLRLTLGGTFLSAVFSSFVYIAIYIDAKILLVRRQWSSLLFHWPSPAMHIMKTDRRAAWGGGGEADRGVGDWGIWSNTTINMRVVFFRHFYSMSYISAVHFPGVLNKFGR